jgi:hypothetical protein
MIQEQNKNGGDLETRKRQSLKQVPYIHGFISIISVSKNKDIQK